MPMQCEKTLLEMLTHAPKFIGSYRAKVNNQRRVSFPHIFYHTLLKFNSLYKYKERELIILNPGGSRVYSFVSSQLLKSLPIDDAVLAECVKEECQNADYPRLMPFPLYNAVVNLIQCYASPNINTAFFSTSERLKIDGQGRMLLPSKKEYGASVGKHINFIGVGPTIDMLLETNK